MVMAVRGSVRGQALILISGVASGLGGSEGSDSQFFDAISSGAVMGVLLPILCGECWSVLL